MAIRKGLRTVTGVGALAVLTLGCGSDDGASGDPVALDTSAAEMTYTPSSGGEHAVEIEPRSLERGEIADLANAEVDAELDDHVPYYFTFSLTVTSDDDVEAAFVQRNLQLVGDDTFPAEELSLLDQSTQTEESPYPEACDEPTPQSLEAGETVTSCVIFMLSPDSEPVLVSYVDPGSNPVRWELEDGAFQGDWLDSGESADIELTERSGDVSMHVETVTVTAVEPHEVTQYGVDAEGKKPYLVSMEMRNDSTEEVSVRSSHDIYLRTASGQLSRGVQGAGREVPGDRCPAQEPDGFIEPGESALFCTIQTVDAGDEPVIIVLNADENGIFEEAPNESGSLIWHFSEEG